MKTKENAIPENDVEYTPDPKIHTAGMILVLLILLLLSRALGAQSLTGSLIIDKTIMGVQSGVMVKKQNANGFLAGVFYQKNIKNSSEISIYGYEYAGLLLGKELFGCEEISISPYLKLGMSDRSKVVISPAALIAANLKNRLSLELHTAMRAGEPSAAIGLTYQLYK